MNNETHEMDYKRAIKLLKMPANWFNTEQKAELRNKAISFLNKNPEFAATVKTIVEGKVTDEDRSEAWKKSKARYDLALKGNTKLQDAEKTLEEERQTEELCKEMEELYESHRKEFGLKRYQNLFDLTEPGGPPYMEYYKERLESDIQHGKEEKDKKDKSIKVRITKFFNKIRRKEEEPTPEEVLLKKKQELLARIDDLIAKQKYVEETRAACNKEGFMELDVKSERYHSAIRNLIHLLGYDEQELYDKEGKIFHTPSIAKANVEARFVNIASKAYDNLPTTDKFEARDTKNIPNFKTYVDKNPRFSEFDEMDR